MSVEAIILAAGDGVRMRSSLPKALHTVGGVPMLARVIVAAAAVSPARIHVVVGGDGDTVKAAVAGTVADAAALNWVAQKKPLGTGDAVKAAMPAVTAATVLLLYGDTPLITADTLIKLINAAGETKLALLTAEVADATGLGRIVRDGDGMVTGIVEEKDADAAQKKNRECNTGFIAAPTAVVKKMLAKLTDDNAQKEFYLTDIVKHAAADGVKIKTCAADADETAGVNCHADLARAERIHQRREADRLLAAGVRVMDPARLDVRGRCAFGGDCVVDVNVILEGEVTVGDGVVIGAGSIVRDAVIGDGSVVKANCIIDGAVIGARCSVGPFARLRPLSELKTGAGVGNFVEIKKTTVGGGSKVNHLTYLGDAVVGGGVNIGAGVITCNYDGADKHRTVIGDDVFVGSDSQLVAPVTVGDGATIGAGSTITDDVAAGALALGRAKQTVVDGWTRPKKVK